MSITTRNLVVTLPRPVYGRLARVAEREHRSLAQQAAHMLGPAVDAALAEDSAARTPAPDRATPAGASHADR